MVLGLIEKCELRPDHHVTFDNFFSSLTLLEQLSAAGYGGTGTIRENRVPKESSLTSSAMLNKRKRGSLESICTEDIMLVRWKDNRADGRNDGKQQARGPADAENRKAEQGRKEEGDGGHAGICGGLQPDDGRC